jgi:hypothetical protein
MLKLLVKLAMRTIFYNNCPYRFIGLSGPVAFSTSLEGVPLIQKKRIARQEFAEYINKEQKSR